MEPIPRSREGVREKKRKDFVFKKPFPLHGMGERVSWMAPRTYVLLGSSYQTEVDKSTSAFFGVLKHDNPYGPMNILAIRIINSLFFSQKNTQKSKLPGVIEVVIEPSLVK